MEEPLQELGLALALILVIEGLLYALLPDVMRRMHAYFSTQPAGLLRWIGVGSAATGVACVWIVRRM